MITQVRLTINLIVREKEKKLKTIIYIFLTLYNWLRLIEMQHCNKYVTFSIINKQS